MRQPIGFFAPYPPPVRKFSSQATSCHMIGCGNNPIFPRDWQGTVLPATLRNLAVGLRRYRSLRWRTRKTVGLGEAALPFSVKRN